MKTKITVAVLLLTLGLTGCSKVGFTYTTECDGSTLVYTNDNGIAVVTDSPKCKG
jgi:hypothetical protein